MTVRDEAFESEVLGGLVRRLLARSDGTLDPADLEALERMSPALLVAARIDEHDVAGAGLLEAAGFREVEQLVTYSTSDMGARGTGGSVPVRKALPADEGACVAIGRRAFTHDRFHADSAIPSESADELKARWVANDLAGRADLALVVDPEGDVSGFILCLLRDGRAVVDLVAVDPSAGGRGLGAALLDAALIVYQERAEVLEAGTQASNVAACRMYERAGMTAVRRERTFHRTATP